MLYYYHKDAIHISKIDLYVDDLEISKAFYTESLGFSVLEENKEYISLSVDHQNELIRLYQGQKIVNEDPSQIIYHFAILLPTRKDLSKFLHHLIIKQIPIDGAADHMVSEAIYLQDPNGIGIEISCDRDDSTWDKDNQNIKIDSLPFDYEGVYYEADESSIFTSLPIETTIGHVHLQVEDLEKIKSFYQNVIGFDIVNDITNDSIYLADKNYHHHVSIHSIQNHIKQFYKMKSLTISYPNCEKFKKAYDSIINAKIQFEETQNGIKIIDPENTDLYLILK